MRKLLMLLLIVALGMCVVAGCSARAADAVATDGSTSMAKVIGALSESFESSAKGTIVTFNPTGSGAGIQAVLEGRCDIGLSSRNLKEEEVAQGLEATVLAYDGIAVIVNPNNPVTDLTTDMLAKIFRGEITNWADVGGKDSEIVLIGREAGSGTREGFERVTDTVGVCEYRQELTATGDVITSVAGNENAIGYASLASIKDTVRALAIDSVLPSDESVKNGSYPVQRPFLLVTNSGISLSDSAQRFMDYATSPDQAEVISFAGGVPAN